MTQFRKWLFPALAALTLAIPLLTGSPAWAQPRPPSIPDPSPAGQQYRYYIFARTAADQPWMGMGDEATEREAQVDADNLRGLGYEVSIRKVAQPTPAANAAARGVVGEWSSDWGPVTFEGKGTAVTGFWQQGEKMRGQIKDGSFDPRTRKLVFTYYQDWNDQHGRAELTLSEDGQTLSGTWKQESGGGDWTMRRKK